MRHGHTGPMVSELRSHIRHAFITARGAPGWRANRALVEKVILLSQGGQGSYSFSSPSSACKSRTE